MTWKKASVWAAWHSPNYKQLKTYRAGTLPCTGQLPLVSWSVFPPVHGHECNHLSNSLRFHAKNNFRKPWSVFLDIEVERRRRSQHPLIRSLCADHQWAHCGHMLSTTLSLGAAGLLKVTATVKHAGKGLIVVRSTVQAFFRQVFPLCIIVLASDFLLSYLIFSFLSLLCITCIWVKCICTNTGMAVSNLLPRNKIILYLRKQKMERPNPQHEFVGAWRPGCTWNCWQSW